MSEQTIFFSLFFFFHLTELRDNTFFHVPSTRRRKEKNFHKFS